MVGPRVLFLLHEQRFIYWEEPAYTELYLPMKNSGLLGEIRRYPFQRDVRYFRNEAKDKPDREEWFLERLRRTLAEMIEDFRPDLVVNGITWPHESIPPFLLGELAQQHGFKTFSVIWDHDESNVHLQSFDRELLIHSDMVGIADSALRTERIRGRVPPYEDYCNVERVHFLPFVADPSLFKPGDRRLYDVALVGSFEGVREEIYQALVEARMPVSRIGGMMPGDPFLPHAEYAAAIGASHIVINTQTHGYRTQLKGRVGQALAAGALLLDQDNEESRRFLGDIGAQTWSNIDELVEMIEYWLGNPDEADAHAARCREAYLCKYNPQTYTTSVLSGCGLL